MTRQGDHVDASGRLSLSYQQDFSDGRYGMTFPFAQTDRDWTLTISFERPGQGPKPQAVFLFRQVNLNVWPPMTGGVEGEAGGGKGLASYRTNLDFTTAGPDKFVASYSWTQTEPGYVAEKMTLADKTYRLPDGRVFLLDLSATPVKVLQVNEDLAGLLLRDNPTADDLRAVRGKLEAKHENVRTFWTR